MNTTESPLYVAAGGGGDVLGALMVALSEGFPPESLHIATFAWERTRFDPLPGPRSADDFRDLSSPFPGVWQLGSNTRLRRGRSFLPTLVRETGCSLYLLDPTHGVVGLRRQLASLAAHLASNATFLIDVGGDILAKGGERGLRSPTADAMALAAAHGIDQSVSVLALGLGLDGELTRRQWRSACRASAPENLDEQPSHELDAAAASFVLRLLSWHPSEVAGLACMAALGYRGTAEVRADGMRVRVDGEAACVHRFRHDWLMERNRIAQAIYDTDCLDAVLGAVRRVIGRTELDDEYAMLSRRERYRTQWLSEQQIGRLEESLFHYSRQAAERQVNFLTLRRVSELLGLSPRPFGQLCRYLARRHPDRLAPPVWLCDV